MLPLILVARGAGPVLAMSVLSLVTLSQCGDT